MTIFQSLDKDVHNILVRTRGLGMVDRGWPRKVASQVKRHLGIISTVSAFYVQRPFMSILRPSILGDYSVLLQTTLVTKYGQCVLFFPESCLLQVRCSSFENWVGSGGFCFDDEGDFLHVAWEFLQTQLLHLEHSTNLILFLHPAFPIFIQNWPAVVILPLEARYIVVSGHYVLDS